MDIEGKLIVGTLDTPTIRHWLLAGHAPDWWDNTRHSLLCWTAQGLIHMTAPSIGEVVGDEVELWGLIHRDLAAGGDYSTYEWVRTPILVLSR